MRRSLLLVPFVLMLGSHAAISSAARQIEYSVVEQSLDKVVDDLSVASGVPLMLNEPGPIVVKNWTARGTTAQVIRDLTKRLALHYNFDGTSYEIVGARSQQSLVLRIENRNRNDVMKAIHSAFPNYSSESVRWVAGDQNNTLLVRGSKRFTETIDSVLKACINGCRQIKIIRAGQAQSMER